MARDIARMNPPDLPDAGRIGYSQISVAAADRLAFVSGQVAWRPEGGAVPGDHRAQAEVAMANLGRALAALEAGMADVVSMHAYLVAPAPADYEAVAEVLLARMAGVRPTLTVVGVHSLASAELKVEIEAVVRV